ncbi:hypothetical protein G7075_05355 [Phycicoccus sp. HDW14]|uniref:hypothetical protein n=1 Tax=Phycicoccus sp. HDW14 TaxID=2714941 RepID=UPI00140BE352|nr:hypothetical protein [Phycicoccus sp. HDW14]QIM20710.1 hypothetical protein G7075_05355 [Phycicoccus sp. HDW14]
MTDRPGEMDERDVDERFASIVAAWDGPKPAADPASPADPSGVDGPADDEPADDPVRAPRQPWVNPSPLDIVLPASSWRVAEPPATDDGVVPEVAADAAEAAEDDEHFEPPAVHLPPQEDLHFWGAVLGLVAGPLCLIYVAMARPFHSTRWFLAGLVLSLGGFALLVLRQPRHRDDTDDGARV